MKSRPTIIRSSSRTPPRTSRSWAPVSRVSRPPITSHAPARSRSCSRPARWPLRRAGETPGFSSRGSPRISLPRRAATAKIARCASGASPDATRSSSVRSSRANGSSATSPGTVRRRSPGTKRNGARCARAPTVWGRSPCGSALCLASAPPSTRTTASSIPPGTSGRLPEPRSRPARASTTERARQLSKGEVRTDHSRVQAGAVVVCVNAYSQHLVPLRVRPVRGQMLATAPVARTVFDRPAYANRGYRYWRQRADGRLLVGGWRDTAADEEVGEEERTTPKIQERLERFLRERCPETTVTHRWAGTMGFSHDALPYVGRLNSGVIVNAGFTGHGMAFATATGELVADLLRGKKRNETDLFAPERP